MRVYKRGADRFNKQLDIRKLLTRMRHFKILQKTLVERGEIHYHQFHNTYKNVIDVDTSSED